MRIYFNSPLVYKLGMIENYDELFRKALSKLVGNVRGAQVAFAKRAKISPSYLCDILKGRKYGKEDKRRFIARNLGMEYEDLLDLGRDVPKKKQRFPVPLYPPQYEDICRKLISVLDSGEDKIKELLTAAIEGAARKPEKKAKKKA